MLRSYLFLISITGVFLAEKWRHLSALFGAPYKSVFVLVRCYVSIQHIFHYVNDGIQTLGDDIFVVFRLRAAFDHIADC